MMRLRRLDLTRFGHFTDRSIDLGPATPGQPDFHIIYGPNEAGKTTLMEGYLRLLYGFPMRDPYGFKHPLSTLQVGGTVEIDGVATDLIRLKKHAPSLIDRHGDVVPETILQACLGGFGQEDYRKLFCLDDKTIEEGGEEITNSKGDIGRLLFAAAAGIGDLTGVLDQVAARAEGFYKKGASKTTFAGLKRKLEEVTTAIRDSDISAGQYRSLRAALEQARLGEATARSTKDAHDRRKTQLAAAVGAHPILASLRAAEADLAPLDHYPVALDLDPEALVALMTARVALEQVRDGQTEVIAKAETARAALILQPDVLAQAEAIAALDQLRGQMEGAVRDLPKRQEEREAALQAMAQRLSDLGLAPGDDPTRFVLPEAQLTRLERGLQACQTAALALANARAEARKAAQTLAESTALLRQTEAAETSGPEVTQTLARFDRDTVEQNRTAQTRLGLARATAAQRMRDLTRGAVQFPTLPAVTVTQRQAEALAADLVKADHLLATLRSAFTSAAEKLTKAQARLAHLAGKPDLITDDRARALRHDRDALWSAHRGSLDAASADRFAAALQQDDAASALRLSQSQQIADHGQAALAVREAEAEHHAAQTRLTEAEAAEAALDTLRLAHLQALDLPESLSAADLSDWLRQHTAAREAQEAVLVAQDSTEPARQKAEALRRALAALPGLEGDDLDTLFRLAQAQAEARNLHLTEVKTRREAEAKDAAALAARQSALTEAQAALNATEALLQQEAALTLPEGTPLANLRDALPALRGLREINETVTGLTRQITGMTRDQDAFVTRLAAVSPSVREGPLAAFHALRNNLTTAQAAQAEHDALTKAIANATSLRAKALADLATQDAQVRQLAAGFAPDIPTETLQDLRQAVLRAQQAIALRASIARLTLDLTTRLGLPSRHEAEDALASLPLDIAQAELASLSDETPRLTQAIEAAIAARSVAQDALTRVQGDADVARRVAEQRTLELEMQDGTLSYLQDRFAHLLAERAIRRYRDTHRGGMLVATEAAFRTLTHGAYGSLTTQTEGASEALVAIQTADGSAKQARDMSKGTRFQLYLALRAAAYEQVAKNGTVLPFFCDDIFETFDEARTTAACGLLSQIGQRGQAIYLTHHSHVVSLAKALCGEAVQVHDLG